MSQKNPKDLQYLYKSSRNAAKTSPQHVFTDHGRSCKEWTNKEQRIVKAKKYDSEARIKTAKKIWTRTSPAELFYQPAPQYPKDFKTIYGTNNLLHLCVEFEENLLKKPMKIRANLPKYEPLPRKPHVYNSLSDSLEGESKEDEIKKEVEHKKRHPQRLHPELWYNDPGETNLGHLCCCSAEAQLSGIRHNIYVGENSLPPCNPNSNNANRLYHYRITFDPYTNFSVTSPTVIKHDGHEFIFEGFSMFSHKKLDELPPCKAIRFNIEYTIMYCDESFPLNFTIKELNLFYTYLFQEILELVDLDLRASGDSEGCPQFHFMPRFVRKLAGNGKEILSMNEVLSYLLQSARPLIPNEDVSQILAMSERDWRRFTDDIRGMVVTYPGKKPCSLRIDQLDRGGENNSEPVFPKIVHISNRPNQLCYAGNPEYRKAWNDYAKFKHLLANKPKPSFEDQKKLESLEMKLKVIDSKRDLKRAITVVLSSEHFLKTGIMTDMVQHALMIPILVSHLRFHQSLYVLEEKIKYKFNDRYLLQLALIHPSFNKNFGTNPDHVKNSLSNCGLRKPVYGDPIIKHEHTKKKRLKTLIKIMSQNGKTKETESQLDHYGRLEFLGDAVLEFISSVHLFSLFPDLEEGGLTTFRSAIVENHHLALLAKNLHLNDFMLYAHGPDLDLDSSLRHTMANCFEALMGALFLDGGIEVADKVFGETLFHKTDDFLDIWVENWPHPLQEEDPLGDRQWIPKVPWLQKLAEFEDAIGIQFTHIRLLARAFTDKSVGYTNLTLGSNQRLEFFGDTILNFISSEYLYKHFPGHHEGHLSMLRSVLVSNQTLEVVCNDLGMAQYARYKKPKDKLNPKDRADLLEAFIGALYLDQGLEFCKVFCDVCIFPRLENIIMQKKWNDPKSNLQQRCLALRTLGDTRPEIPEYNVIECQGPSNSRTFTVAVDFCDKRLATASGISIQQAEMKAAKMALENTKSLFPQFENKTKENSKNLDKKEKEYFKKTQYKRNSSPQRRISSSKCTKRFKAASPLFSAKSQQMRSNKSMIETRSSTKTNEKQSKSPRRKPEEARSAVISSKRLISSPKAEKLSSLKGKRSSPKRDVLKNMTPIMLGEQSSHNTEQSLGNQSNISPSLSNNMFNLATPQQSPVASNSVQWYYYPNTSYQWSMSQGSYLNGENRPSHNGASASTSSIDNKCDLATPQQIPVVLTSVGGCNYTETSHQRSMPKGSYINGENRPSRNGASASTSSIDNKCDLATPQQIPVVLTSVEGCNYPQTSHQRSMPKGSFDKEIKPFHHGASGCSDTSTSYPPRNN